jgi:hypothetical protein
MGTSAFPPDLEARLRDTKYLERVMQIGVNRALMRHKRLGESIAGWDEVTRTPKIVPPEEIPELDTEWPADLYYGPRDNPNYKK